jgi:hypothetical protein
MISWCEFADLQPVVARLGKAMLFGHDVGLGFLATVRPDGGPRVHPTCPLATDDGLFGFIVPGPKLHDLRRDPRYSLHSETFPPPNHDDAFCVTGEIIEHHDEVLRSTLSRQFFAERRMVEPWAGFDDEALIEYRIERVLLTLTIERDGVSAGHTIWSHRTNV